MRERTLQRLANIDARFGQRIRDRDGVAHPDRESFSEAFRRARDSVLLPVLREVAAELEIKGHRASVEIDDATDGETEGPSVTLRVVVTPRRPEGHRVGFVVIERGPVPQVLALLEATPPVTDVARYQPDDLTRDVVEQIVVDALEHIFACVAELP